MARPQNTTQPTSSRWLPAVLIFLAVLSTAIGSLGTPLLPAVQREFSVSLPGSQWALTITLLVGVIATPVMGRLGSGSAHRATTLTAVAAMTLGCALSALPAGFVVFLVGRGIQGVGLGLIPLAMATARTGLPEGRRATTMATIGVTTAVGIGIGYPVVGALAELGSWAGIDGVALPFWFVACLGVLCLIAVCRVLPRTIGPAVRIGTISSILLAAGLALVLLALSEGADRGWGAPLTIVMLAAGSLLLTGWVLWELRVPHPLIDLRQFRHPAVLAANVSVFLIAVGFYPLAPLVVRLVQTPASTGYGFGTDVVVAGLMLAPFSLASFLANRVVQPLLRWMSAEAIIAVSCVFPLASFLVFLFERSTYPEIIVAMALNGFGIGLVYAMGPLQISRGVTAAETSSAMSTYQLGRSVAYSLGSALSATLLVAGMPPGTGYPPASGYSVAAVFSVMVLVVAMIVSIVFALIGRRRTPQNDTAEGLPAGVTPRRAPGAR